MNFTKKLEKCQKPAMAVGFILSVISALLTIKLLCGFGQNGFEKMLYGVFGGALQSLQTICFIAAAFSLKNPDRRSWLTNLLFSVYFCLFTLSIVATVASFSQTNSGNITKAMLTDNKYKLLQAELKELTAEKKNLLERIADGEKRLMITKIVKPCTKRLAAVNERSDAVRAELKGFKGNAEEDAAFVMLADFFGVVDAEKLKLFQYIAYGIALDTGSCVAFCIGAGLLTGSVPRKKDYDIPKQIGQNAPGFIPPAQAQPDTAVLDYIKTLENKIAALESRSDKPVPTANKAEPGYPTLTVPVGRNDQDTGRNTGRNTGRDSDSQDTGNACLPDVSGSGDTPSGSGSATGSGSGSGKNILTEYVKNLFPAEPGKPDGSLLGRDKVADLANMSNQQAKSCHEHLKKLGLVSVRGSRTFPEVGRSEMLKQITGGGDMRKKQAKQPDFTDSNRD